MSDKRRFFKHTLIFGFGGAIDQLVPFILLPLYTNFLTPGEFGILGFLTITTDIFKTVFLIGGVRLAAMTFYKQAESEEARRRIAVTVSTLLWLFVAVAIATSVYFINYIDLVLKTGRTDVLAFGLAVMLLETLIAVPMTLTQARLESLRYVLTNIVMGFTRMGLCIYFVAGLQWDIWGILYAQAIIVGVFATYLTCRELRIGSIYPDVTKWKEIFLFALPLVPSGIFTFIYSTTGRVFVLHIGPYDNETAWAALGLYVLASKMMSVSVIMGARPMEKVWSAVMYDIYKKPDAARVFGTFTLRLLCVKAFAVLLISLFALEVIRIMCDSSYYDAAALVPLFGLLAVVATFSNQMDKTFFITRKTNQKFLCTLFALPFLFLFMYLLVPRWGIWGAIIGQILARIILTWITYFITQRLFPIRFPLGKIAVLYTITACCYGLSLLCGNGIELSPLTAEQFHELSRWEKIVDAWNRIQWISIIAKIGMMLLWGILIWFSSVLSKEDKALAIRVLKRGLQKIRMYKAEP